MGNDPQLFRVNFLALEPFDILFLTNNSLISRAVRWGDSVFHPGNSKFSHVQLHLRYGFIIDARFLKGVRVRSISRVVVNRGDWFLVRRPTGFRESVDPAMIRLVSNPNFLALTYAGKGYDPLGAILSSVDQASNNHVYICSELVTRLLTHTGFYVEDLVNYSSPVSRLPEAFITAISRPEPTKKQMSVLAERANKRIVEERPQSVTPLMLHNSRCFKDLSPELSLIPINLEVAQLLGIKEGSDPMKRFYKRLRTFKRVIRSYAEPWNDSDVRNLFSALVAAYFEAENSRIKEIRHLAIRLINQRSSFQSESTSQLSRWFQDLMTVHQYEAKGAPSGPPRIILPSGIEETWPEEVSRAYEWVYECLAKTRKEEEEAIDECLKALE